MKKFKKLLAGILAGAMMLGSMTTTAFADEGAGTASTTMPTIDRQRTGSLTIHKYEYNYEQGEVKIPGTGSADDTVPNNAKPLSGIKFEITKAYDLTDYYKMDGMKLPTVEEAKTEIANKKFSAVGQTTDNDGIVTFNNLALGIYLVHESDSSAQPQITGKVEDFLVSIPMTNKDRNDWLYDVHVFPKNSSTYAGVTLQKKGKIGSADANALDGATFVLQKKGTGASWTTITNNNKGVAIGTDGVLTTDTNGKITVSDLAPGTYRFVETSVPSNTGYIMNGRDTKEFEITTEGTVKIGTDIVDTTQKPIEVINYKPNVEKEVKNAAGNWGNDSDYSAGDEVPYRVTVDVPSNIKDLREFVVTDTMEHQAYKGDSLKIYSNEELSAEILNGQYTVNKNNTGWSISFNTYNDDNGTISSLLQDYAGAKIYISFKTVLGEDALTTSAGNPNTVKLEYSNKILPSSNGDGNPNTPGNPGKDEITDQATVYTFKIAVEKVDAENTNTKLEGVKFDLYRKLADDASGKNVLTDPVKGLTGKYEKVKADLTTKENGEVSVNGLKKGTYYLVETKTNNEYNLLKAPVEVKIAATYTTKTTTTTVTDTSGKTTTTKVISNESFENAGEKGVFKTVIKNSKGFTLPTTGGMGTVIFSVLGIALVLAGLLVISASRKKAAK